MVLLRTCLTIPLSRDDNREATPLRLPLHTIEENHLGCPLAPGIPGCPLKSHRCPLSLGDPFPSFTKKGSCHMPVPKKARTPISQILHVSVSCPFYNYWDKHARLDTLSSPGRRGGGASKGHSAVSTQSQAVQVETSLMPRSFEPHLNRLHSRKKSANYMQIIHEHI